MLAILSKSKFLIFLIFCLSPCLTWGNSTLNQAKKWLQQELNISDSLQLEWKTHIIPKEEKKQIEYTAKQRFYFKNKVYLSFINFNDKKFLAIIDNVLGKAQPITFIVLFDEKANYKVSHILRYREPYGGGIQNSKWLSQFIGKKTKSDFRVGSSIQGISAATISVHSITKGIFKLNLLAQSILKQRTYETKP